MQAPRYCPRCGEAIPGAEGAPCRFCPPRSLLYWQGGITFVVDWRREDWRPIPTIARTIRAESKDTRL